MRYALIALFHFIPLLPAGAQWRLQTAPSTADFYAVQIVDGKVAWASGAEGTVVRTEDGGQRWTACATPKGEATSMFTGVQAFDADTAIVMTSGKGIRSRLYKTADACKTWKLVFTNPDDSGVFVSLRRVAGRQLYLLGQPVDGKFAIFLSRDGGDSWDATNDPGLNAMKGDTALVASNSALWAQAATMFFGAASESETAIFYTYPKCDPSAPNGPCAMACGKALIPTAAVATKNKGIASLAGKMVLNAAGKASVTVVAVGGTPKTEGADSALAAYSLDGGKTWEAAHTAPRGYRSSVAYDVPTHTWIAVGEGGTDISRDNGQNWSALPDRSQNAGSDAGWTALSLPFAVGSHGRIGILSEDALKPDAISL